jgi:hypothetical protein
MAEYGFGFRHVGDGWRFFAKLKTKITINWVIFSQSLKKGLAFLWAFSSAYTQNYVHLYKVELIRILMGKFFKGTMLATSHFTLIDAMESLN